MTIDEAIKHAEEVAEEKENEAQDLEYFKLDWKYEAKQCSKCAKEHRQLAEWLKELKQLREQTRWVPVSDGLPEDSESEGNMEDIELVIKIPQKWFDDMVREEFTDIDELCAVIQHGTLQPKTGRWIFTKTILDKYGCTAECPSCHKKWKTYDEIRWEKENKFCPNCGAKKQEVEENDT